jgi:hypothetical protein
MKRKRKFTDLRFAYHSTNRRNEQSIHSSKEKPHPSHK